MSYLICLSVVLTAVVIYLALSVRWYRWENIRQRTVRRKAVQDYFGIREEFERSKDMISNIANLAINVANKKSCAMTINEGKVTVNIGKGKERKSLICGVGDEKRLKEFTEFVNLEVKE